MGVTRLAILILVFCFSVPACAQSILYVEDEAPSGGDGTSWATAFRTLQDALAAARQSGGIQEVRIAGGLYRPDQGGGVVAGTRSATFQLINGVAVKGGHAGRAAPAGDTRDPETFKTVLSGDLAGNDGPNFANNAENSYHVVTASSVNASAVLDGVTVTAGHANASTTQIDAGGLYAKDGSPTVRNCTFSENARGGVYLTNSDAIFQDCLISDNSSTLGPGGMYCSSRINVSLLRCRFVGNQGESPGGLFLFGQGVAMTDCVIHGNSASGDTGGLRIAAKSSTLLRCTVADNFSLTNGGVYVPSFPPDARVSMTDCTISRNVARLENGGLFLLNRVELIRCRIIGNRASSYGGVRAEGWEMTFRDCVIRDNLSVRYAGGIYFKRGGTATMINCLITGNASGYGVGGVYCDGTDPVLTHCTIVANRCYQGAGGLRCVSAAPTLTNCIVRNEGQQEILADSETPVIAFSNINGGWPGTANIDADPRFAEANDYHLAAGSPCADAGTPVPPGGLPDADFEGSPRLVDVDSDGSAIPDMGAYERDPAVPTLAISADHLEFHVFEGEVSDPEAELQLRNSGGGVLNWQLTGAADWLQVMPASGTTATAQLIGIRVRPDRLSYGQYACRLELNDPAAINHTRSVDVTLYVNRTLRVPQAYPTIQAAVNAAVLPGDVVSLAPGTYIGAGNREVAMQGKLITVRGEAGAENTIIDCQQAGRGFTFFSMETTDSVIEGVTVCNGKIGSYDGGAVLIQNAGPSIRDCIFRNCNSFNGGALYYNWSAFGRLERCTIADNVARGGGGIYCATAYGLFIDRCSLLRNRGWGGASGISAGPVAITRCRIEGNLGSGIEVTLGETCITASEIVGNSGTGIVANSALTIRDCLVTRNSGGGLSSYFGGSHRLMRCAFIENSSENGGGIRIGGSNVAVENCLIAGNVATREGGGVYIDTSGQVDLTNCLILNNRAVSGGAISGRWSWRCNHCTIVGNRAAWRGGFLYMGGFSSEAGSLSNCIIRENLPPAVGFESNGAPPTITYCNIEGGYVGEGNIDADPRFAFPDDFHLLPGSPCVDAGAPLESPGAAGGDYEGRLRVLDGDGDGEARPDMGAFERDAEHPVIAVSPAAPELFVPTDMPLASLRLKILNAGGGTLHWEAHSSCDWLRPVTSSGDTDGEVQEVVLQVDGRGLAHASHVCRLEFTDTQASLVSRTLPIHVHLTQSFPIPSEYPTIQAAIDAASVDGDTIWLAPGVYRGTGNRDIDFKGKRLALRSTSGPDKTVIDCEFSGAGIHMNSMERPGTLVEGISVIRAGKGFTHSPAIKLSNGSSPTIRDCTMTASAGYSAQGMSIGTICSPDVANCRLLGNSSSNDGGGVYCYESVPLFENCIFAGNYSDHGGAISVSAASPVLVNCLVVGNATSHGEPDCAVGLGNLYLINCTLANNGAGQSGDMTSPSAGLSISNSILWTTSHEQMPARFTASLIRYSDVEGGWPGDGNIIADPGFVSSTPAVWSSAGVYDPEKHQVTFRDETAAWPVNALAGKFLCPDTRNWLQYPILSNTYNSITILADGETAADGYSGVPAGATYQIHDYRLSRTSACIDAGDNLTLRRDAHTDLRGWARRTDAPAADTGRGEPPIVDMGAFEFGGCFLVDLDQDGDVDLDDVQVFAACAGGPALPHSAAPGCASADLDGDQDVDQSDFGLFQRCFSGAGSLVPSH